MTDLTTSDSHAGHSGWLRYVAAFGLPGSVLEPPRSPLDARAFSRLHSAVCEQRLTGLLWAATTSGHFPTTPQQLERIRESHRRRLAGVLVLERLLVDTVDRLSEAGIPSRVLKGAAMAHLDYSDPAHRAYGDIDILVPGHVFDDAIGVLLATGGRRRYPEPRPGFDSRFGKGACIRTTTGLEIDVHRTFSMGPYGERLALDDIWQRSESYSIAGRTLEALAPEARLLHAAYHAVLGDVRPRLAPLRDIAQLALSGQVDWGRLWTLMEKSGGDAVVARGISMAWHELRIGDVLTLSEWAAHYREDQRAAQEISVYVGTSSYAARAFATVSAIRSLRDKTRYVSALVLPSGSYVTDRYSSRLRRLRQGVHHIRQTRSTA